MNHSVQNNAVSDLLPHDAPMMLLSQVCRITETGLEALVDTSQRSLFSRDDGSVPAWVGMEYMAQAIAAYAGQRSLAAGEAVRIGFLLGSRKYSAQLPQFDSDSQYRVVVEQVFISEENLASFDCTIYLGDQVVAQADIKAIQMDNVKDVLESRSKS